MKDLWSVSMKEADRGRRVVDDGGGSADDDDGGGGAVDDGGAARALFEDFGSGVGGEEVLDGESGGVLNMSLRLSEGVAVVIA
jgi:hypothetical protein